MDAGFGWSAYASAKYTKKSQSVVGVSFLSLAHGITHRIKANRNVRPAPTYTRSPVANANACR